MTISEEELIKTVEAVSEAVKTAAQLTLRDLTVGLVEPVVKQMGILANAQIQLAALMRSNRRDFIAAECMKTFMASATPDSIVKTSAETIAKASYMIADAMEKLAVSREMENAKDGSSPDFAGQLIESLRGKS